MDFTYGGVSYVGSCTKEEYSWCATSVNSDGSYATWAYCGFGDPDSDECTFPYVHMGSEFHTCTQNTRNGWCANSVYANTMEPYSNMSCQPKDYWNSEDILVDITSYQFQTNGTGMTTVKGENCVDWYYSGKWYNGTNQCYGTSYTWCATSTYDDGTYKTYSYCGYGNSQADEPECIFPWVYNGIEYSTCTAPTSSGWCATSIYEKERSYSSYKYCDEDEQALGYTTVSYGMGTTITGEDCVPFIYSNVRYTGCQSQSSYAWCATSVNDDGSYKTYAYCGYGDNTKDQCVFPFVYSSYNYTTCTQPSTSGWCATSVYEFSYSYASYRYCTEEEAALGYTETERGWGKTITDEDCVPMIYSNIRHLGCTSGNYGWCATEVTESGSYSSYAYCGYGNKDGDTCTYPYIYSGEEYDGCYPSSSPWCPLSIYEFTQAYYNYKSCNYYELEKTMDVIDLGSTHTVGGEECLPFIYSGKPYKKCTSDTAYGWCATAVSASGSYSSYGYCGYGNSNEDKCTPMMYSSTYYKNCTEQSTSGWCATSTYLKSSEEDPVGTYYSYRYCTDEDWEVTEEEYVCEECPTTVDGNTCRPFKYNGELVDGCVGSPSWCATSVDSSNNYVTWAYCGYGNADEDSCYFPFKTSSDNYALYYTTCTTQDSSGWCATATYEDGLYYSWKYCDDDEQALGMTTSELGEGRTVSAEECVPMVYSGVYYKKCTNEQYSWCATSVNSNQAYVTWQYCGYGDSNGETCAYPLIYSGETYDECVGQDTSSPWCATSVYEETAAYYTWKYCDDEDLGTGSTSWGSSVSSDGCVYPFSYLGVTYLQCTTVGGGGKSWCATSVDSSSGNYVTWQYCTSSTSTTTTTESSSGSMRTLSDDDCVPMIYGDVYYEACTDDTYGWCATSTDSSLNYQTWGYCKLGDGENCYFPYKWSSTYQYECVQKSSYGGYGWCGTSTYTGGDYYSWKYCTAEDVEESTDSTGEATTVTGEDCVPMTYGGVYYSACTDDNYSWCATSTSSEGGTYTSWAYCGYGDSNEDNCVYPFEYNGISYTTCTEQSSSGWCATSVYQNTKGYYSYKYCDEDDLALGYTTLTYGEGTTVDGQDCVPMIYSGVKYTDCNQESGYSWCATSTNDDGSYASWQYCGYGDSNNYTCVPMIYSGVNYNACTQKSTSGWCATSAYENTKGYYSYKYCEESDWTESESSSSDSDTDTASGSSDSGSSDTTVTGEDCVTMIYGGVTYDGCTSSGKYGWCATSTNSDQSYATWAYCGYGDSYADECYYPFYYSGQTYYSCVSSSWCATSVYRNYDYYSWKYCDEDDLGTSSDSGSTSGSGSGSSSSSGSDSDSDSSSTSETVSGKECSFPFLYKGQYYYSCTTKDFGNIPWCATSVGDDYSVQDWNYCKSSSSSGSSGSGSSGSSDSSSGSGRSSASGSSDGNGK